MAPPSFADLGKDVRDLFSKGFHSGIVKLDLKTVAENKVEFKISGSHATVSGKTDAKVEGKYKCKDYGTTLTETWDTKNVIGCKVEVEDKLIEGMKLALDSSFHTDSGAKNGSLKTSYKHKCFNGDLESGLMLKAPVLKSSAVIGCPVAGYEGWLLGGLLHFDCGKSAVSKNEMALAYNKGNLKLLSSLKDLSEFGASVYNKVSDSTEVGVSVGWTAGTTFTKFGVAAKHKLDKTSHVNMAADNSNNLKLGYTNEVSPGVKLTLAGVFDTKAISGGDHKLGMGVDVDFS
ncbi:non-selective voltage-gated ion channel VDAC2-like [Convolutriloba macropyga]|uniref:non-selective voltage-gated ion channel VDAC2-like n=1 Tax=Convolutriloba macropyga TaxID=536237 RepID=UPI003F51C8EA